MGAASLPARGDEPKPADPKPAGASVTSLAPSTGSKLTITTDAGTMGCREQAAQPFLIRGNWFPRTTDPDKVKEGRKLFEDSLKYRTEKYGYFEGFGLSLIHI